MASGVRTFSFHDGFFLLTPQQEIINGDHRVLLTSPEMCLDHPDFSKLMRSSDFTKDVAAVIIDEAHCILQWGANFRKRYADFGKLRPYVSHLVPFLVVSAMLPPHILQDIITKLWFSLEDLFSVNLGNDRPNITSMLCEMRGAASDLAALDFTIDVVLSDESLRRMVIFFNSRDLTYKAFLHLRRLLPDNQHHEIGFIHGFRSPAAKHKIFNIFREGVIKILCAMEAAGMVCKFASYGYQLFPTYNRA